MSIKENQLSNIQITGSYFTSVISISLVLFLLGIVGFMILNAQRLSDYVKENIGFNIELKDNIREADIQQLRKILDAKIFVKSTEYITKEQAAAEMIEATGEDFITDLGYNPLPPSIKVKLNAKYANTDSIAKIENELSKYKQISEIIYRKSLIHEINKNVQKISLVIISFTLLLFLIALSLINNTIRLSIYSKRFLIHTMQLVGATRSFIRRPFIIKSAWHGLISGMISIALLILLIYFAQKQVADVIEFVKPNILAILFGSVILIGILISSISSFFAVNKYLKNNIDALYI